MMKKLTSCFAAAAFLLAGFFSCSPSGDLGSEYPKTNVTYTINLDESKKSQPDEGDTSFYQVPAGTIVEIKADAAGPEKDNIYVNWKEEEKQGAAGPDNHSVESLCWQYAPENAAHIEISGTPAKEIRVNGEDAITNEKKKFVIEWVHDIGMEIMYTTFKNTKKVEVEGATEEQKKLKKEEISIEISVKLTNNTNKAMNLKELRCTGELSFKNRRFELDFLPGHFLNVVLKAGETGTYSLPIIGEFDNKGVIFSKAYATKLHSDLKVVKLKLTKRETREEEDHTISKVTWRK